MLLLLQTTATPGIRCWLNPPDMPISDIWVRRDRPRSSRRTVVYVLDDIDPCASCASGLGDRRVSVARRPMPFQDDRPHDDPVLGETARPEPHNAILDGAVVRHLARRPPSHQRPGRGEPSTAGGGRRTWSGRGRTKSRQSSQQPRRRHGSAIIVRSRPEQRDLGFAVPGLHDVHAQLAARKAVPDQDTHRARAQRERTNTDADISASNEDPPGIRTSATPNTRHSSIWPFESATESEQGRRRTNAP